MRAEILRAERPLRFVHPLVRDAIHFDRPAGDASSRTPAPPVCWPSGRPPERVAAQLLQAPRRGDRAMSSGCARPPRIAKRGAPDAALAHLQRAQAEPPAPELGQLTLELGVAAELFAPAAAEALARAHAALTDRRRASAAVMLARTLLFTGHAAEGGALAREAAAEAPPDARMAIEAMELIAVFFGHDPEAPPAGSAAARAPASARGC